VGTFTPKSNTTISHLSFQTAWLPLFKLFCKVWDRFIEVVFLIGLCAVHFTMMTFRRCVTIANCTTTNSSRVYCKILRNYCNPCILARLHRNLYVATEPSVIADFTPVALWHLIKQRLSCAIFVDDSL
jgi:hypothetical protein